MRTTVRCESPRCEFDGSERAAAAAAAAARGAAQANDPAHLNTPWGRGGRRCHQEGTQSSLLVRVQSGVVRAFVRATMLNKTAAKTRGFIRVRGGRGGAFGGRGQTVDVDISRRSSVIMGEGGGFEPPGTGCSRVSTGFRLSPVDAMRCSALCKMAAAAVVGAGRAGEMKQGGSVSGRRQMADGKWWWWAFSGEGSSGNSVRLYPTIRIAQQPHGADREGDKWVPLKGRGRG